MVTNEKNVPTQVQPIGGAKFGVCFTPTQANDHIVSITFNNIAVNGLCCVVIFVSFVFQF